MSGGVLDMDVLITTGNSLLFIFLHSSYSYDKENELRVKKEKWTTLTSSSGLLVYKIL